MENREEESSSLTAGQINRTIYSSNVNSNSEYRIGVSYSQRKKQELNYERKELDGFEFSPVQLQNKLNLINQKQQYKIDQQGFNSFNNMLNDNNDGNNNFINHNNKYPNNHHVNHQEHYEKEQFINSNSIVKRYQLLLITLLIMSSIASVRYSNSGTFTHIKTITDQFNIKILGNTNPSIYEFGDNIDESSTEIVIFEDMNEHFDHLIDVVEDFMGNDSFIVFENSYNNGGNNDGMERKGLAEEKEEEEEEENGSNYEMKQEEEEQNNNNAIYEISYLNGTYTKTESTLKQLEDFLFLINRREFLLNIKEMQLQFIMGKNKRLEELNLTITYSLSSRMMLNIELEVNYLPNGKFKINADDSTVRVIEQLLAFLLLCSYLHNAYTIKRENNKLKKFNLFDHEMQTLQTNRAYWCYSLVLLNIITMLNETYAPLASFLQLLPIFERHDSANAYKYNFNTNLRYALPIVMRIFIPVVILLNGFIFYSMLMYPGEYFEDYATGFFSYVYQNFQVGTYEIFIELENEGNFAYLLYGVLYFYMVLVGSNLLPALFCTMIYIKIYQNDLKDHIQKTIKLAICPKCGNQNLCEKETNQFEINIQSPKISPYLKGKLSSVSNNKNEKTELNLINKVTKMFVETEKDKNYSDEKLQLKSSIEKIKSLLTKLETVTKQTKNNRQLEVFDQKILNLIIGIQESLMILSPLKSPLNHHRRG